MVIIYTSLWPSEMLLYADLQELKLQQLKTELNNVKSKLDLYNLNDWHKHTRAMNKAGEIQWKLRNELEPEFLTQVQQHATPHFSHVTCNSFTD